MSLAATSAGLGKAKARPQLKRSSPSGAVNVTEEKQQDYEAPTTTTTTAHWRAIATTRAYNEYLMRHFAAQLEEQVAQETPVETFFAVIIEAWKAVDLDVVSSYMKASALKDFVDTSSLSSQPIKEMAKMALSVMAHTAVQVHLSIAQQILINPLLIVSRTYVLDGGDGNNSVTPPTSSFMSIMHTKEWREYLDAVVAYHFTIVVPRNADLQMFNQVPSEFVWSVDHIRRFIEQRRSMRRQMLDQTEWTPEPHEVEATGRLVRATIDLYKYDSEQTVGQFFSRSLAALYPRMPLDSAMAHLTTLSGTIFADEMAAAPAPMIVRIAEYRAPTEAASWNHSLDFVIPNMFAECIVSDETHLPGELIKALNGSDIKLLHSIFPRESDRDLVDSSLLRHTLFSGIMPAKAGQMALVYQGNGLVVREPTAARRFVERVSTLFEIPLPQQGYAGDAIDNEYLYRQTGGSLSPYGHQGSAYFLSQVTGKAIPKESGGLKQAFVDYRYKQSIHERLVNEDVQHLAVDVQLHPDYSIVALALSRDGDTTTLLESVPVQRLGSFIRHHPKYPSLVKLIDDIEADERLATNLLHTPTGSGLLRLGLATFADRLPTFVVSSDLSDEVVQKPQKQVTTDAGFAAGSFYVLSTNVFVGRPGGILDKDASQFREELKQTAKNHMTTLLVEFKTLLDTPSLSFVDLVPVIQARDAASDETVVPASIEMILRPFTEAGEEDAPAKGLNYTLPLVTAILAILWPLFPNNQDKVINTLDPVDGTANIEELLMSTRDGNFPYILESRSSDKTSVPPRLVYAWMILEIIRTALSYYVFLEIDLDSPEVRGRIRGTNLDFGAAALDYIEKLEDHESRAQSASEKQSLRRLRFLLKSLQFVRESIEKRKFAWLRDWNVYNFHTRIPFMLSTTEGRGRLQAYMAILALAGESVIPTLWNASWAFFGGAVDVGQGVAKEVVAIAYNIIDWSKAQLESLIPTRKSLGLPDGVTVIDYISKAATDADPTQKPTFSFIASLQGFRDTIVDYEFADANEKLKEFYNVLKLGGVAEDAVLAKNINDMSKKLAKEFNKTEDFAESIPPYLTNLIEQTKKLITANGERLATEAAKETAAAAAATALKEAAAASAAATLKAEDEQRWVSQFTSAEHGPIVQPIFIPGRLQLQHVHHRLAINKYVGQIKGIGGSALSTFLQHCPTAHLTLVAALTTYLSMRRGDQRSARSDLTLPSGFNPPTWDNEETYAASTLPEASMRSVLLDLALPNADKWSGTGFGAIVATLRHTSAFACDALGTLATTVANGYTAGSWQFWLCHGIALALLFAHLYLAWDGDRFFASRVEQASLKTKGTANIRSVAKKTTKGREELGASIVARAAAAAAAAPPGPPAPQ